MNTPTLRPQMGACEINKGGRRNDEGTSCCSSLRWWLIVWACMRLVASVLWTFAMFMLVIRDYDDPSELYYSNYTFMAFGVFATIAQLVELGMLVTFIFAGIKKNANLYRVYYRYCILSLVLYIISATLCFAMRSQYGYIFGQIYLTHQFSYNFVEEDMVLGVAVVLDICLELLLIYLIKKLINKYQFNEDHMATEAA